MKYMNLTALGAAMLGLALQGWGMPADGTPEPRIPSPPRVPGDRGPAVVRHGVSMAEGGLSPGGMGLAIPREERRIDGDGPAQFESGAWLGVLTDEASETLAVQLGLDPGTGLVVTHVAPASPAGKAGIEKNDILIKLDDQRLVHPAQLRKLVQVRKEGDEVRLAYLRAGREQSATVALGKPRGMGFLDEGAPWRGNFSELSRHFQEIIEKQLDRLKESRLRAERNLPEMRETLERQLSMLKETMGGIKLDQERVREDLRRGIEEARRAIEQAVRQAGSERPEAAKAARQALAELRKAEAQAGSTSVTVRSGRRDVRSMVKSDDDGTLMLVNQPNLRLTAHDKDGKLLFDGPIATREERAKVPEEVMKRAEPMLKEFTRGMDGMMGRSEAEEPEAHQEH